MGNLKHDVDQSGDTFDGPPPVRQMMFSFGCYVKRLVWARSGRGLLPKPEPKSVPPRARKLITFAHLVGNPGEFTGFLKPTIWLFAVTADRDVFAGQEAACGLHLRWRC